MVDDAEEDALVRRLLLEKYKPTYSGDLSEWGQTVLAVESISRWRSGGDWSASMGCAEH